MTRSEIKSFRFDTSSIEDVKNERHGMDWPVVYLINNEDYAYIGETSNIAGRLKNHLDGHKHDELTDINIIFDDEFNKSAVLDIEQSLIQLYDADKKYSLKNLNSGQSSKHNYYQREKYTRKIEYIWEELRKKKLVQHQLFEVRNSDLFKYSPYITLTQEQESVCEDVINDMTRVLKNDTETGTALIEGCAGTGKTIIAIKMMFMLVSAIENPQDVSRSTDDFSSGELVIHNLNNILFTNRDGSKKKPKIGFVVPMTSIRSTMKKVFKRPDVLKNIDVIGPNEVVDGRYDILFVDESHRLTRRKNIVSYKSFDDSCKKLGLDNDSATSLDWIIKCSRYRVLFYDKNQSVKNSDIPGNLYNSIVGDVDVHRTLVSQMRCEGGNLFLDYVTRILECRQSKRESVLKYDFLLFDDVGAMVNKIKELNKLVDENDDEDDAPDNLCRVVAGYSWKWNTKNKTQTEIEEDSLYDIDICGHKYYWNTTSDGWVISKNAVNEIGCVHTVQGFDLNYVAVIFGEEIDYDANTNDIVIYRDKFYDTNVKNSTNDKELKDFIINTYKVLMTRGIKGCFVYACNRNLNDYLKKFINKYDPDNFDST